MTEQAINQNINPANIVSELGSNTKAAAKILSQKNTQDINALLAELSKNLKSSIGEILESNQKDIEAGKAKNLSPALLDRLLLNAERIDAIAQSVLDIAALEDPVGHVLEETKRPNGLVIQKTSVPIGVLGLIYESRPNVTIDAASLCLKSRNGVILRGGSESFHSSRALHSIIQKTLENNNFPKDCVSIIPNTDREMVGAMLAAHEYIDVIIPRGGKGLTGRVMSEAQMPVFAHLDGNCHIYLHSSADPEKALQIVENAKLRRTGICGAAESLLFDRFLDEKSINDVLEMLINEDCEIAGDEAIQKLSSNVKPASETDWSEEYLDKKISAKVVEDINEAITHINQYGSHHTDAIIAEDQTALDQFSSQIDSAIVMQNASTQFADGGEFGMGAEIGIGTGKLHARGPVGLKQLTTFKYVVIGNGQTRP
ncbi:MAG: glutamate-5-semialdehyde dehydrogenase [Pseudomonadota bacterium]